MEVIVQAQEGKISQLIQELAIYRSRARAEGTNKQKPTSIGNAQRAEGGFVAPPSPPTPPDPTPPLPVEVLLNDTVYQLNQKWADMENTLQPISEGSATSLQFLALSSVSSFLSPSFFAFFPQNIARNCVPQRG